MGRLAAFVLTVAVMGGLWYVMGWWLLVALLAIPLAGALWEAVAHVIDRRRWPAPGRLIDVGGHRLHLYEKGEGGPAVVLEAGGNNPGLFWHMVQQEVATFARVVAYDRAGHGWSDLDRGPRTGRQVTEELHTLLRKAGIPGPYVMVGHSLGAMYVRLYAGRYPDDVAGLVLVDPFHEDLYDRQPPTFKKLQPSWDRMMRLFPLMARLGVFRLLMLLKAKSVTQGLEDKFPDQVLPMVKAVFMQPKAVTATLAEFDPAAQAELKAQMRSSDALRRLPVTVLSASRADPAGAPIPPEEVAQFMALQHELHAGLAARSDRGQHLVVPDSGHSIQIEQPAAVARAIRTMVDAVR